MKATIKKADILPVLARLQGITGRKSNLAITTNVLLRVFDDRLTISATDLETGFEGSYPAKVDSPGNVAINARKFYEIVRDFPSDDIFLNEVENHWIEIGNQTVEYHIVGMKAADFPEIPRIEGVPFFEIDSENFAGMIEKTVIIGGASDDRRAHIIGAYAERIVTDGKNVFRLVSTDGSRLGKVDYRFGDDQEIPPGDGVLIPKKGLVEVGKFLDQEGRVQIGFKDSNFIVKKERETLIIRLLEGDFPQYEDIILKSGGVDIPLERHLFLMMLKRMSILASDEYRGVIFNFTDNQLNITSTNPDIGESKEDMPVDYSGPPITVMFNPKFFIETLNVIDEDMVTLNIVNDEKPCLLSGETDDAYLSVIMPMRI